MADLESLLNDVANLDAQHDLEGLRRIREEIVTQHPESDAAVAAATSPARTASCCCTAWKRPIGRPNC